MAIQRKSRSNKKPRDKARKTKQTKQEMPVDEVAAESYTVDQVTAQKLEASHNKQRGQSRLVSQSQRRDREFEISYKQILLAADQGKRWAFVELGAYAEYQRDYRRAIEQYEKLAVQGDLYYMRRIAVIYEQSLEDIDSAIDWYTEAGHYGDEHSMIRAANLLELHFEDYDESVAWYRKAAQAGNLAAIYHLCRVYQHNLRNFDTAIAWYQRAVQLGDLKAAIALGQLYENSLKDYNKAVEWYTVAANYKSLYAVNLLCQLYETKLRDYPRAIEWYKKAITLYNEHNSSEQVHAADSQGQQSMTATDDVPDTPVSEAANPVPQMAAAQEPYNPSFAASTGSVAAQAPETYSQPTVEDFDDLLPRSEDLTPTEIASATGMSDEAEVEFLG